MTSRVVSALLITVLAAWIVWQIANPAVSPSDAVQDKVYYYRLKSSYLHHDMRIDFDVIAACGIRIDSGANDTPTFNAVRYPSAYVKATPDGGAIFQYVTAACGGETTANGQAPKDLMPGAIWFEDKNDLSLGVGYFTEDAFENSQSALKFLGSSIERATEADWRQFQPELAKSLLDARPLIQLNPWPSETEVKAHLWDKNQLAQWTHSSFQCWLVERLRIEDASAREKIAKLWPQSRPTYWSPGYPKLQELLQQIAAFTTLKVGDTTLPKYSSFMQQAYGFPTRARGGRLLTAVEDRGDLPPPIYPFRADDGVPWARAENGRSPTLYRDIDFKKGAFKGFSYCYSFYSGYGAVGELHLPGYQQRDFATRVDGVPVKIEGNPGGIPRGMPDYFFEGDEYLFHTLFIRLN